MKNITYHYRLTVLLFSTLISFSIQAQPEIDVQGNSTSITDGDITPSNADYTDFGTANSGTLITRTYTIYNTGSANLTISSIALSNAIDFSITGTPYSTPITSGGNTTFTITFNSLTLGTKTTTVTITNNDVDEPTYQFDIEARSEQNFFDSDGDGVLDNIDIDDDNDGITDSEEELACKNSSISITSNYKFLNETFGTGNRTTINTTYDAVTTYCYENGTNGTATTECPSLNSDDLNDGEYTVYYKAANGDGTDQTPNAEVASWADAYWYTGEDHTTGDSNGRMAMFNASYDPGTFYTATIIGSLPNVPITYSFWVLNLDTTNAPGIATRLRPDILVEFRDVNNNVLASITTGDIPPSINGDPAGSWHQFTANLTFNVSEFYVYFINNEIGGGGNDLAIDDIEITQTLCDTDSDGVADVFDLDSDNDGIPDVVEAGLGNLSSGTARLTTWVDSNGNGMHDGAEGFSVLDSDGDGTPNYLDLDSDNDTIFDVDESGAGNTGNPTYQNGDGDINGDGVGDGLDTDEVREKDFNSDGTLEFFTDGILDIYDYHDGITFANAYGNTNQGLGSTFYVLDSDSDGLPDYIDVTSNGVTFDISNTLYASLDANNDGVIDDTVDSDGDGILNLFDTDDAAFGSPRDIYSKLDLYFDGRNDYVEDVAIMGTWPETTIMGWIKIDPSGSGNQVLIGQNEFYLELKSTLQLEVNAKGTIISNASALPTNQWIHVGATYSSSNNILKLFINGEEIANTSISGSLPSDTTPFTIGREPNIDAKYFKGFFDEVRVFNTALTNNEYQKMVYQEIENNTFVRGTIVPKDINTLPWTNVVRYFRFDTYKGDIADDLTTPTIDTGSGAKIYNVKLIDLQSAPMPFITQQSGSLPTAVNIASDGVNGNDAITYDWSIVRIEHDNINYNAYQKHLALFVDAFDAGSNPIEFSVQNDSELNVSWYLKLDGFIDLEGESQLVQGLDSELDVTSAGALEKDQQGTRDLFTYNYWSSPVGISNISNNNNNYTLPDVLSDGTNAASPVSINFLTSSYDGTSGAPIGIADYWIWKYANQIGDTYSAWQHVRSTGNLLAGEGFTMKGIADTGGLITLEQNYALKGKPNNGDISLTVAAGNDYLVGNPYPSAIDANEFILDNTGIPDGGRNSNGNIINGALYFWDHFASGTHNLASYEGGYATYTLIGGTAAISNDIRINATGVMGTKIPERYIPVSQGFFVSSILDAGLVGLTQPVVGGDILFINSQRIFRQESVSGANTGSVFFRSNAESEAMQEDIDSRLKIRLMFDSAEGYHRQLLVGVDQNASIDFDLGYDAPLIEANQEDMFWYFNDTKFIIQAVNDFNDGQVLPIGIKTNKEGLATIRIDALENIDENTSIFVHDKVLNIYHDLRVSNYELFLSIGEYLDRFEIVFNNNVTLSDTDNEFESLDAHFSNAVESIIIINPTFKNIKSVELFNILGQSIYAIKDIPNENYSEFKTNNISSGTYIIKLETETGTLTKKVLVE